MRKFAFIVCTAWLLLLAVHVATAYADWDFGPWRGDRPGREFREGLHCLRLPGPFAVCDSQRQGHTRPRKGYGARQRPHTRPKRCQRLRRAYVRRHGARTPSSLHGRHGCSKWRADYNYHRYDDNNAAADFINGLLGR